MDYSAVFMAMKRFEGRMAKESWNRHTAEGE